MADLQFGQRVPIFEQKINAQPRHFRAGISALLEVFYPALTS
jgi:hypothetical protein